MSEIITMPQAMRVAPVEIDDSRLNAMWARQNRKGLWLAGAAGAFAVLVGVALVVMAFRLNAQPPVVNVAAPVVNVPEQKAPDITVNVPQQPAPVVNVTPNIEVKVPQQQPIVQAPTTTLSGNKVVTEHTIFHRVEVENYTITTGWNFRSSNDTAPYQQYCNAYIDGDRTRRILLAENGHLLPTINVDARAFGIDVAKATALAKNCVWTG